MKKKLFNIAKIILFVGLGFLLVWLVLRNLSDKDKIEIKQAFLEANYWWIGASLVLAVLSHFVRALRWKLLLQSLHFNPKTQNTFYAVMVGYLANTAVPRLGEVSRCGVLTRYENIPFEQSFGTVIAERLIDTVTLLLIFFAVVWLQFDKIFDYTNQKVFQPMLLKFPVLQNTTALILIGVSGLTVLFILYYFFVRKKKKKTAEKQSKFKKIIDGFLTGLATVKTVKKPFWFWFYSAAIWILYYLVIYLSFFAFEQTAHLGGGVAWVCLAFGTFGFIAVQGGIGAYPLIIMEVLSLFGIASSIGYAFGWVAWCASTIVILLLGFLSLIMLPLVNKNKV